MRADVSSRRVAAFSKRLLQVSSSGTSHFAAGSLFLVSELLKVPYGGTREGHVMVYPGRAQP